mmetsp:Transcript_56220/g.137872  ORF Transcript_56220/g.137872 Transcript_56220/m.137872 type:complete len:241 (+) Transcript_56220:204-926(+)
MSVLVRPGQHEAMKTLRSGPSVSLAMTLVSCVTPAFDTPYALFHHPLDSTRSSCAALTKSSIALAMPSGVASGSISVCFLLWLLPDMAPACDDTLTILPCGFMIGRKASIMRFVPRKLVSTVSRACTEKLSCASVLNAMPALLTRISTPPWSRHHASSSLTDLSLATSSWWKWTCLCPALWRPSSTSWGRFRAHMTTLPLSPSSSHSRRTHSSPMPRFPPVTRAMREGLPRSAGSTSMSA